MMMIMNW